MMASLSFLLVGYGCLLVLAADLGAALVGNSSSSDGSYMDMKEEELLGLFEVMSSLLEDPAWAQMHPEPCGATPWPGVGCEIGQEEDGPSLFHITTIHIGPDILNPPCKSSALLSESLAKLPFLKTLSVVSCFTTSPASLPPSVFGSLLYLEHLSLESNPFLIGAIPPSLSEAADLRVLCLKESSLHGGIPEELGGLVSLEQLDLSFNNLSGQIPPELGGLKRLTILDLSWNHFEGELPGSLGNCQLLQKMDLSSNRLHGTIPQDLSKLEKLVLLDLSHNLLQGPIPSSLSGLVDLEYLLMDDNPISAQIPVVLSTLRKLKTLSFSRCRLMGSIPTYLPSLKNLTGLSLNNNNLSGEIPENLGLLPNLNQLNLSNNQLSGQVSLPEYFIYRLGRRLDIRGNRGLCISCNEFNYSSNVTVVLQVPECVVNCTWHKHDPSNSVNERVKPSNFFPGKIITSDASRMKHLHLVFSCLVGSVLSVLLRVLTSITFCS